MLVLSCYKFISDCKDTTFFSNFHSPFWSFFILHLQITTIFRIFAVFFSPLSSNRHIQKKRTTVCYPVIEVVGYLTLTDNQHSCPCCIFYAYAQSKGTQKIHTDICCDLYLIRVSKLPTFQWLRQTSVSKRYIFNMSYPSPASELAGAIDFLLQSYNFFLKYANFRCRFLLRRIKKLKIYAKGLI